MWSSQKNEKGRVGSVSSSQTQVRKTANKSTVGARVVYPRWQTCYAKCVTSSRTTCPVTWLEALYLTFEQASLLIMRCGSSSLSSSSSSQLGEGVPSAPNVALQEPPLLSLGSNGSTTMGSVPLISQRQKGHPVPWPSDSCTMGTRANVTLHRGDRRLYIHTIITEHIRLSPRPFPIYVPYLPGSETWRTHQMTTGLNLHILVIFSTDLTQLESGAHLAIQLILFLAGETNIYESVSEHSVSLYTQRVGVFLVSCLHSTKMNLFISTFTKTNKISWLENTYVNIFKQYFTT